MVDHKFYLQFHRGIPEGDIEMLADQFSLAYSKVMDLGSDGNAGLIKIATIENPTGNSGNGRYRWKFELGSASGGPTIGDLCFGKEYGAILGVNFKSVNPVPREKFQELVAQYGLQLKNLYIERKAQSETHS